MTFQEIPKKHGIKGEIEKELLNQKSRIVGVDEVGRGCLAGPVFAGCVMLNYNKLFSLPNSTLHLIRDSKTLSSKQRSTLIPIIKEISIEYHVNMASSEEIEHLGIVAATFTAMKRAIFCCKESNFTLLTDGKILIPGFPNDQKAIISGDSLCYCIAAASIIAKQARDIYMQEQAIIFPQYGFDKHVGYGTKTHTDAISKYGICSLHRKNFAPIRSFLSETCK